jgi:hypothetical protein
MPEILVIWGLPGIVRKNVRAKHMSDFLFIQFTVGIRNCLVYRTLQAPFVTLALEQ